MAPVLTGYRFGFGSGQTQGEAAAAGNPEEYVIFGGNGSRTNESITVAPNISEIRFAGCGSGGQGTFVGSSPGTQLGGGGGGSAVQARPAPYTRPSWAGMTTLYVSVAGHVSQAPCPQDTYAKVADANGADIWRVEGGNHGPENGTSGGPGGSAGPGPLCPNCIAGGSGGGGGSRFQNGSSAPNGQSIRGGGGGGGFTDNNQPGKPGGSGGTAQWPSMPTGDQDNFIETLGVGPGPGSWVINSSQVAGGPPGGGASQGNWSSPGGTSYTWAKGGAGRFCPGGAGGGGGGGGGGGMFWNDPGEPNHNEAFGGGGGGDGSGGDGTTNPTHQKYQGIGGGGLAIVQLIA